MDIRDVVALLDRDFVVAERFVARGVPDKVAIDINRIEY